MSRLSSVVLALACLLPAVVPAPGPTQLPRITPFETGLLAAESFASATRRSIKVPQSCSQVIAGKISEMLEIVGLDVQGSISDLVANVDRLEEACKQYENLREEFDSCTQRGNPLLPVRFGVVALLEVACRAQKTALISNYGCIAEMEATVGPVCRHACIDRDYKGFTGIFKRDPVTYCGLASCIARCVSAQVQECDVALGSSFADLAGIQTLLGIENILGAGSPAAELALGSDSVPFTCRRFIWRALLTSAPVTTPSPTKNDSGVFAFSK